METRPETVYLVDEYGDPYVQVDQWVDKWIVDEDGNETDEAESFLFFTARRHADDKEITKEEYEALLPAKQAADAERMRAVRESHEKAAKSHQRALKSAEKKLKELGLTPKEAAAIAALGVESDD